MRRPILVFAACLLPVVCAPSAVGQSPPAAGSRLEGDWVRIDPDGAGDFGGLGASIPPAQLLPGVSAGRGGAAGRGGRRGGGPMNTQNAPNAVGVPYIVVEQPCAVGGGRG